MGRGTAARSGSWLTAVAAALLAVAHAPDAAAATARHALLVSHHDGGEGLPPLKYAHRDVMKVRQVLVDLGGFAPGNVEALHNGTSQEVIRRLRRVEEAVRRDRTAGQQVVLLVYYSGHAKDGVLRLGKTKLDLGLLRAVMEESQADVRLAVIDACGAGEMTREKGGVRAPPLVVSLDDALTSRGQVIIASSSESEASQESDDIQGSFFTHFWVSGLRGDADRNTDGKVTLDEAYTYAYARTVAATLKTRSGVQHPTYRYDLRGAGDVVLSNLGEGGVRFPAEASGRFVVFDLERQLVVAEVDKAAGAPVRIAVKGGTYAIKQRGPDHLLLQRVKVARDGEVTVDTSRMERVDFDDDYAKGDVLTWEPPRPRQGLWGLSLSGGMGVQAFFNIPWQTPTFPATSLATVQARYHGLFNKHLLLGADFNVGGREYQTAIDGGGLGTLRYPARFLVLEAGTGVMWEQELWRFRVAAGPRLGGIFLYRQLLGGAPVRNQFYMNLTPGLAAYAGLDITRFLHVEAGVRGNYLLYANEGFKSIGYLSATLAMHADL